jgi:hypothetical protein
MHVKKAAIEHNYYYTRSHIRHIATGFASLAAVHLPTLNYTYLSPSITTF